MNARTQITMDAEMQRRAQAKAAQLGISFDEYVRRLVERDIGAPPAVAEANAQAKPGISAVFDLIKDGPVTDIARDKDKMIGEALWQDHLRSTGQLPKRSVAKRRSSAKKTSR